MPVTSKKSNTGNQEIKIKYSDKSPGQPQLIPIFDEIKKNVGPLGKRGNEIIRQFRREVVLISKKPVEILGRKRDELWFASATCIAKMFKG